MGDWRTALLKNLGYRPTKQNLRFLDTWQRWEGGHTNNDARFNWLNTTRGNGRAINSVGVKSFGSFRDGIRYTTETLRNGRYQDILDALASGNPYAARPEAGLQTWVSGSPTGNPGYAQKVLGGKVGGAPKAPAPHVGHAAAAAPGPAPKRHDGAWDYAMSLIFADDPEMVTLMAGMDDFDPVITQKRITDKGGSLKRVPLPAGKAGAIVDAAQSQLGKPYVFGSGPDTSSFDCSDLIQWAYAQVGIKIPRVTYDQIKIGRSVKGQKLQPGDLFFSSPGHVMMYVGNGKLISAPQTGQVVQYKNVSDYGEPYEVRRVMR